MLPTTYPHRRPSVPSPAHLKPPCRTGISPYGGSSGPGNLTSETLWATSSNPSTYRWTFARCSFVVRPWFLAKCAAVCFGTTAVRHSTHAMIRCLREWWKYRAKTLARGGVGPGASIARRIYRIVWLRVGIAVSVAECLCGLGTGALAMCLCYAPPASMPTTTPRLIPTAPNPTTLPLPPPATTPRLRSSISGGPRVWPCFRPTSGG